MIYSIEISEFQPLPNGVNQKVIGKFLYKADNKNCIDLNHPDLKYPEFANESELLEYVSNNLKTIKVFQQADTLEELGSNFKEDV